jgi:hypothetical protein
MSPDEELQALRQGQLEYSTIASQRIVKTRHVSTFVLPYEHLATLFFWNCTIKSIDQGVPLRAEGL